MKHIPSTRDFPVGMRVRLRTHRYQLASLGMISLVVNLGKQPYVTGTICNQVPDYMRDFADFRPDGWPLPDDVNPPGFGASVYDMEHWPDGPAWPCIVTDNLGNKVSPELLKRLVDEHVAQWRRKHPR